MKQIEKKELQMEIDQHDHRLACTMLKGGQRFTAGAMLDQRQLFGFDEMSDAELVVFGQMANSMANAYIREQQRRGLLPSDTEIQNWVRLANPLIPKS